MSNKQLTNYCFTRLLAITFVLFTVSGNATIYYVSSSGDDKNPGTSENLAWCSLAKVNSFFKLQPGDQVLFKRGDEWIGTLKVRGSGKSGNPIIYGAYGTGAKPKIYGSEKLTGWTLHSGNIYKATLKSTVTQLFLNDSRMKAARYPNSGYATINSVNSTSSFSCNALNDTINYIGAKWIGRTIAFATVTLDVVSSNSKTLTLSEAPFSNLNVNEGFILVNKLDFLDSAGEWYYDDATNMVYLWAPNGDSPANYTVRGSTFDYGVEITSKNYISVRDLNNLHNKSSGISLSNSSNITIDNNTISFPDSKGIYDALGSNNIIINNTVNGANHFGIELFATNSIISDNEVNDTFLFKNIGISGSGGWYMGSGIYVEGDDNLIKYNRVINSGYNGIHFNKRNIVEYNFIKNANLTKDDGGGIYTSSANSYPKSRVAGSLIRFNIIDNVPGTTEGWNFWIYAHGNGIYLDENAGGVIVENNTVLNCSQSCIYLHKSYNETVRNNTVMNARATIQISTDLGGSQVSDNIVYSLKRDMDNKDIAKLVIQKDGRVSFNKNTYINHYNNMGIFKSDESSFYDFERWKTTTGQDTNSTIDLSPMTSGESEKLFYNDTKQTKTFNLGGSVFRDINGKKVSGTFSLEPFTSKILIGKNFEHINQNPDILDQSFYIIAPKFSNEYIGKVVANDPDTAQTINYYIVQGNEKGLFVINSNTGEIYAKTDIQTSKDMSIVLAVLVTDNAVNSLSGNAKIKINIKGADTSPPTITLFSLPSTAITLTIPITDFAANDNVAITGFKLAETSNAQLEDDSTWTTTIPTDFTFSQEGIKILYAWVKDSAGNISAQISDTIKIILPDMSPTYSEYLFEESEGITVIDSKGSNNGTIIKENSRVEGVIGNGLTLNGIGYINLRHSFGENVQNELTLSAWVKPTSGAGNYQGIIVHGGPNVETYALYIHPDSKGIVFKTTGTSNALIALNDVNELWDGKWHHLAVIYNGSAKIIYLDNIALIKIDAKGKLESGWMYNLLIGVGMDKVSPTHFYEGLIDEVRIYNYALTDSEISELYHPVNRVIQKIYTNEDISICEAEEYKGWTETGHYERVLKRVLESASGADSIITTNLRVDPLYIQTIESTICEGETYIFGNQTLNLSGEYIKVFKTINGCDSTVILTLTVNPSYNIIEKASICQRQTYIFGTQLLNSSGEYTEVFKTINGCDSTVILSLTVNPAYNNKEKASICEGQIYTFGTQTLNLSGEYTEVFKAFNGCDSVVTLTLTVNPIYNITEDITISSTNNYLGWTQEGNYQRILISTTGCDSTVVTILKVKQVFTQKIDLEKGWNIFSSYLVPTDQNMESVLETLRIEGKLVNIQDEDNDSYEESYPQIGWINNIGNLHKTEGYKIRVTSPCTLEITGQQIQLPLSIEIKKGLNLISFPINGTIDAMQVIEPLIIAGILKKIQDEKGNSIENWANIGWINGIGNFYTGEGYILLAKENVMLTINEPTEKSNHIFANNIKTSYFRASYEGNGFDHMNINVMGLLDAQLSTGDEIAVFDNKICVGAVKLTEKHFEMNSVSIPASASEANLVNGFIDESHIELKVWDRVKNEVVKLLPEVIEGKMIYTRQTSVFVKLKKASVFTEGIEVYPNPASKKVYIRFLSLPEEGANVLLLDITGKQVLSRIVQSNLEILNIEDLPPGIYLIRTCVKNKYANHKLMIT